MKIAEVQRSSTGSGDAATCQPRSAVAHARRLRRVGGFRLGVQFVDLLAVAFFDHAAAEFHAWASGRRCRR